MSKVRRAVRDVVCLLSVDARFRRAAEEVVEPASGEEESKRDARAVNLRRKFAKHEAEPRKRH